MSKLVGNANKSIQGPLNEITCGVVLAFEPYGLAYRALVKNMEKRKNVITFNMGLGKSNGFARNTIESMPDFKNYGMNSLVPSDEPSSVPVTTIDVIGSNGLSRCNFIKIDVEGLEIEVLEGASNTISKFKPYLDIEVNDYTLKAKGYTREQLFSKLRELGYKWTPYSGNESMEQFDIIATAN
jgi:FkbM family methyltransferase